MQYQNNYVGLLILKLYGISKYIILNNGMMLIHIIKCFAIKKKEAINLYQKVIKKLFC